MTDTTPATAPRAATFTTYSPTTGKPIAEHPVNGPEEVSRAVARARTVQAGWVALPASERREHLLRWKKALASDLDAVAGTIAEETGKPAGDAALEVVLTLEHLGWAARNAQRVLRRRKVGTGLFTAHQRASLVHRPLGVVGVIGPWNYPVYTPMGSIGYALAAGNAVVFKPSELTPATGVRLAESFDAAVPGHAGLLTSVTGAASTGDALARSGVDKLAFTGSPGTARKVMAVCAETLTPFLAECGGKDAVIVTADADADLDAAADAVVWGALSNAGQTCAGVERVYAVREIHAALCERVVERAGAVRPGAEADAAYGPMTLAGQAEIVERHVTGAISAGARALLGGPESVRAPYIAPVVLTGVPEDAAAMTEETFGPVVAINPVTDVDEAVERANASRYALGAAVFCRDRRAGAAIAARLRAGAVSVNSVLGFAAVPALPFGGSQDSGFGRIHGAEGLRAFTSVQSTTVQRFTPPIALTSFGVPAATRERAVRLARALHRRR
ncbi:aldehyde dehydrogenase family protein [Streptomyces cinnabarinus]|uniref:Aldehyde dehydrogenase n=1 Tax=Streptomyces cinnabarinus TaxID=67287 RepID=A0ABY7KTX1_9ACTN|nr:aldehyde dehydrogenase family protein [Streptomyces cinnabarinus]WAZ26299.1 aldehyde dehydrogenase family protein [Streptomyces cinnabarinus]